MEWKIVRSPQKESEIEGCLHTMLYNVFDQNDRKRGEFCWNHATAAVEVEKLKAVINNL